MAAPSSSTPSRSSPVRPPRRFSLEQANRALPLVKRIVADIVRMHGQASVHRETIESFGSGAKVVAAQRELDVAIDRLEELVEELNTIGVELKDYETGLVDFVGRHDG